MTVLNPNAVIMRCVIKGQHCSIIIFSIEFASIKALVLHIFFVFNLIFYVPSTIF